MKFHLQASAFKIGYHDKCSCLKLENRVKLRVWHNHGHSTWPKSLTRWPSSCYTKHR